ncbi:MAG: endonuclease domain-containing protein [Alphaproteobacteria bacterium]|nr:endonuclease domain-containing protein [Alphaproteobacteria bacterium]
MIVERARDVRRDMTAAEAALWRHLRNRRFRGLKFRRQVPVDRYIVYFICKGARFAIEIDGPQHAYAVRYDAGRTAAIEGSGYLVLRFCNNDVLGDIERVLSAIAATLPSAN